MNVVDDRIGLLLLFKMLCLYSMPHKHKHAPALSLKETILLVKE